MQHVMEASKRKCYVCQHSMGSASAQGLTLHGIPVKSCYQSARDSWLAFLHLPLAENWPTEKWRNISLCSLHFKEADYRPGYQKMIRSLLEPGAVPTQNQPAGPGLYGELFPPVSLESSCPVTSLMESVEMQPIAVEDTCEEEECAEKIQEDMSGHLLLEDVRKEFCRLCGQKGYLLSPIFKTSNDISEDTPLSLKIEIYLPFKVKMDDPLPSQICSNCHNILEHWHELYVSSVAANEVLWKAFGSESEMSTQNDRGVHITRIEDDDLQDVNTSPKTNAVCQEEPPPSGKAKEDQDVHCKECVKNKMLSLLEEEDSFIKEFDNCFANFRSKTYKCSFCYELFKSSCDRRIHMAMCRQLSTICESCGLQIPCRKDLRIHKYLKHTRKNIPHRYLCDKCDKCFKTTVGLSYHIECVHEKNLCPQYHCQLCCSVFVGKHHYRMHQKKHEKGLIKSKYQLEAFLKNGNSQDSQNDVPYSCPVCQEIFDDMLSLIVHLNMKKIIKCSGCLKVLSCEKHFMAHVCDQWKCQYCLKTFDKKVKLIVHERLHTGEKPFKCRTCDLVFRSYQTRRRHEEHHLPAYQCSYCGKSFKTKCVFRDHVLCHEGETFSCHICGRTFSGRTTVNKHINKFHKKVTAPS